MKAVNHSSVGPPQWPNKRRHIFHALGTHIDGVNASPVVKNIAHLRDLLTNPDYSDSIQSATEREVYVLVKALIRVGEFDLADEVKNLYPILSLEQLDVAPDLILSFSPTPQTATSPSASNVRVAETSASPTLTPPPAETRDSLATLWWVLLGGFPLLFEVISQLLTQPDPPGASPLVENPEINQSQDAPALQKSSPSDEGDVDEPDASHEQLHPEGPLNNTIDSESGTDRDRDFELQRETAINDHRRLNSEETENSNTNSSSGSANSDALPSNSGGNTTSQPPSEQGGRSVAPGNSPENNGSNFNTPESETNDESPDNEARNRAIATIPTNSSNPLISFLPDNVPSIEEEGEPLQPADSPEFNIKTGIEFNPGLPLTPSTPDDGPNIPLIEVVNHDRPIQPGATAGEQLPPSNINAPNSSSTEDSQSDNEQPEPALAPQPNDGGIISLETPLPVPPLGEPEQPTTNPLPGIPGLTPVSPESPNPLVPSLPIPLSNPTPGGLESPGLEQEQPNQQPFAPSPRPNDPAEPVIGDPGNLPSNIPPIARPGDQEPSNPEPIVHSPVTAPTPATGSGPGTPRPNDPAELVIREPDNLPSNIPPIIERPGDQEPADPEPTVHSPVTTPTPGTGSGPDNGSEPGNDPEPGNGSGPGTPRPNDPAEPVIREPDNLPSNIPPIIERPGDQESADPEPTVHSPVTTPTPGTGSGPDNGSGPGTPRPNDPAEPVIGDPGNLPSNIPPIIERPGDQEPANPEPTVHSPVTTPTPGTDSGPGNGSGPDNGSEPGTGSGPGTGSEPGNDSGPGSDSEPGNGSGPGNGFTPVVPGNPINLPGNGSYDPTGKPAPAAPHQPVIAVPVIPQLTYIDFSVDGSAQNALVAGNIISEQFSNLGVGISVRGGQTNQGMIFDGRNITGEDWDLAFNGNLLIISEDGDAADPDDDALGGTIHFEFDSLTNFFQAGVLDVEDSGSYVEFHRGNELLATTQLQGLGDNSHQFITAPTGIEFDSAVVYLNSSGGITEFSYGSLPQAFTSLSATTDPWLSNNALVPGAISVTPFQA